MARGAKEKRIGIKQALQMYEKTEKDKREDLEGAKKIMESQGRRCGKSAARKR